MTSVRIRTWSHALAIVALGAVLGCSNPGTEVAMDPAGITESEIQSLIEKHAEFARPVTIEVMSQFDSPTVRALATDGYLQITDKGPVRALLTDKGRTSGAVEAVFQEGNPYYVVPVAQLELVEVSSVEEWPRAIPAKRVAFTYRRSAVKAGRDLLKSGSQLSELFSDSIPGEATLVRYGEDWKIQSLKL